ncbi:glucosamine-6-phosphate deaminase [Herbiconiux sp. KACC 21604]|uniref:glucosamine-6-phosphate deaminase n=1 Tax=unclassified Herbiconiux TaxID=2618217 RepID=UPI0014929E27|nr:glucosamine-6-phosphate deaminase [Herbiconiux sp. SALV-R1]QJU52481.1 glucosamine-6-phosphate deaminase [Herbiconiux sp. SALV-R1]WPO87355.1 glucosamine-6-phosphate deaminase [Herbiconiux sp. KACC 21604]
MAEVIVVPGRDAAGAMVAEAVERLVQGKPDAVLGLATGDTPLPVYRALAERVRDGLDLAGLRGFALDEYVGIPLAHPQSYHSVIDREVVKPLRLTQANVHVPDGRPIGIETAGERYEAALLAAGGVDLQILGIGTDGHIGFNEPGSSFASLTRVKTLTRQTRADNARFFDSPEEVPVHSITQGLGTILRARRLVLLAFGAGKAQAVAAAVEGPLTASVPASAIQLHPRATVVVDEEAAGGLAELDYYRHAFANKPLWDPVIL